ncbi:MAG: hypothetical protein J3K34DRAFT_444988, partial [Monoraphidium minutum]
MQTFGTWGAKSRRAGQKQETAAQRAVFIVHIPCGCSRLATRLAMRAAGPPFGAGGRGGGAAAAAALLRPPAFRAAAAASKQRGRGRRAWHPAPSARAHANAAQAEGRVLRSVHCVRRHAAPGVRRMARGRCLGVARSRPPGAGSAQRRTALQDGIDRESSVIRVGAHIRGKTALGCTECHNRGPALGPRPTRRGWYNSPTQIAGRPHARTRGRASMCARRPPRRLGSRARHRCGRRRAAPDPAGP